MNSLMKAAIAALCAALLGTTLYAQQARLTQMKARAEWAEQDLLHQQAQLAALQDIVQRNQQLLSSLQHKQRQIHATLSEREQHIDQIIQQNPTAQSWAAAALPDSISQLLQRTDLTGANDYLERLSNSDAVPSASISSTHEFGTAANSESDAGRMGNLCSPN